MEVTHISIKQKRLDLGLTQKELAVKIGVDQSAVAQWENGKTAPNRGRLMRVAEALGCSVSDLLDDYIVQPRQTEKQDTRTG